MLTINTPLSDEVRYVNKRMESVASGLTNETTYIYSFKPFESMLDIHLVSNTFTDLVSSTKFSRFGAEVHKSLEDLFHHQRRYSQMDRAITY